MNINRLTQKTVIAAQALTQRNGQPEIGTLHLPQALVDQPRAARHGAGSAPRPEHRRGTPWSVAPSPANQGW